MAVDEARCVGRKENGRSAEFLHLAPAAGGGAGGEPAGEGWIVDQCLIEFGAEIAWAKSVDLETVASPVDRHALGEHLHRALGSAVGRDAGAAELALHGADIDDLAMAARDHVTGNGLPHEEDTVEVNGGDAVPGLKREILQRGAVLHASVIEQNLDRADVALNGGHPGGDRFGVRHVEGRDMSGDGVVVGEGFLSASEAVGIAPVEHDGRAGRGEGLGDRVADAFAGAGDKRDAAGQIEQLQAFPHCLAAWPVSRGLRGHVSDNRLHVNDEDPRLGVVERGRLFPNAQQPGRARRTGTDRSKCCYDHPQLPAWPWLPRMDCRGFRSEHQDPDQISGSGD